MAQSPGMTKNSQALAKKEAYLKKDAKRSQSKTRALTSIVASPSSSLGTVDELLDNSIWIWPNPRSIRPSVMARP